MNKEGKYQNLDYIDSILPDNIIIKRPIDGSVKIHKELALTFIDPDFGDFVTSIRGLIDAGASTHPKKTSARRAVTNKSKSQDEKETIKAKRYSTMEQRGNSPNNSERLERRKQTNLKRYGTENPMQNSDVLAVLKSTMMSKYGVENAMHLDVFKEKLVTTCLKAYGVTNGGGSSQAIEKILKSHLDNINNGSSAFEKEMLSWVRSLGVDANKGYIGGAHPKELDIKVKNLNIAIECNGTYWHSEVHKDKHYHINKTLLTEEHGVKLIHIFDFEWKKRNKQVKSFLRTVLGKNEIYHYARKCIIKEVDITDAKMFLEEYHILGAPKSIKVAYGLYFNEELLSIVTLGSHHRLGDKELVLNRYCGKENISVAGGLGKLTKHAVRNNGPITTWVDRRISNGVNWEKAGWKLISTSNPDYFYFNTKTHEIISKQSRQKKKVNTSNDLTEKEHAIIDNLVRVWDCGKFKFIAS